MEKVYDTTRISNLANDPKQFCSFFCEYIKRDDISIDIALDVLRISSIYYNRFSVQTEVEYNNTFKKCINELVNSFPDNIELISEFESQCKIMHDVNNSFFAATKCAGIWRENTKKSHALILNLIMFCEMFLSSLSSLVVVNDPKKMKRIFPLFIVSENINIHAEPDIEYFRVIDRAFDEVANYTGRIFSYLRTHGPLKLTSCVNKQTLLSMGGYLNEWNVFDSLSRVRDFFRLSSAVFTKLDNNIYSLEVDSFCLYRDYEIARNRLMMRASHLYSGVHEFSNKHFHLNSWVKDHMPSYLNSDGVFSSFHLSELENMSPDDLHEEYGNISLFNWVHAYQCLVELSKEEMSKRFSSTKPIPLQLDRWLIIKSRESWLSFFQRKGIAADAAKKLIDYFTFNSKSHDLNDCPFIPCMDGLCLMPALIANSSVTRSLMSLFGSKKISQASKGRFHEQQFIKQVRDAGIKASPIDAHANYQCDCVILLDDCLIFTELKSNGQPIYYGKYYQQVCNIVGDSSLIHDHNNKFMRSYFQQINRISEHYLNHLDVIIKEFELPSTWQPKGVYKLIVTTTMLGGKYHVDDTYVADKYALSSFFQRIPGVIYQINENGKMAKNIIDGFECCEGEITIDKFIDYLSSLPSINAVRKNIKKLTYSVRFNEKLVHHPYYDSWAFGPYIRKEND
ncbi:hypothetical protein [Escherichia coli]|uniref:hypothetical protein n=1 Tax=Escherichia coli TaxID=562 RepID=UPI001AFCD1D3|nr:hypothetical protein [Escherichia coli]EKH2444005.1 hypothetical protein [Escherichia coli]MCF7270434.1 hypothetical protein [Escherichia coli]HBB0120860.1 hypothetical protein [Escherichia coli]